MQCSSPLILFTMIFLDHMEKILRKDQAIIWKVSQGRGQDTKMERFGNHGSKYSPCRLLISLPQSFKNPKQVPETMVVLIRSFGMRSLISPGAKRANCSTGCQLNDSKVRV